MARNCASLLRSASSVPMALGHVTLYGDKMRHFAAHVLHRPDAPFDIKLRTILTIIDHFSVEDLPASQSHASRSRTERSVFGP